MAHRAGFVAILGVPNAGKSTLLNALLGRRLSGVSPKPQTTRHRILGILNTPEEQAVFVDTPGWLDEAKDLLQESLRKEVRRAVREDCDVAILVLEPKGPSPESVSALSRLPPPGKPLLLAMNKVDTTDDVRRLEVSLKMWAEALKPAASFLISAMKGRGMPELKAAVLERLPESPPYYEKDQLSDRWERFFAAEVVREQIFALYEAEVPHACAVVIEDYKETPRRDRVLATVYVERETQKGILIGKNGTNLRKLTERAEAGIAAFTGRPTVLELWIKVRKDWRRDSRSLKEFGYLD